MKKITNFHFNLKKGEFEDLLLYSWSYGVFL